MPMYVVYVVEATRTWPQMFGHKLISINDYLASFSWAQRISYQMNISSIRKIQVLRTNKKNGIFHARHIIIQFILFTQFVLSTQIENNSCPFFDVICFFLCVKDVSLKNSCAINTVKIVYKL